MATITLKIGNVTSKMEFDNEVARNICGRAWDAYHREGEKATEQEKLDWVLETLFVKTLERASARRDSREEHDRRKAEHEVRREERMNARKLK